MVEENSPRFRSVGGALRFYYRAQEILSARSSLRLFAEGNIRATGAAPRDALLMDYLSIASCLRDLTALQRWLMRALHAPIRFGDPPRTVTSACAEGQRAFPRVRWTPQGVGRLRRHTLDQLERILVRKGLIPAPQFVRQGVTDGFATSQTANRSGAVGVVDRQAHARPHGQTRPRRRKEIAFDLSRARN